MWSCLLPDLNLGVTVPVVVLISHLILGFSSLCIYLYRDASDTWMFVLTMIIQFYIAQFNTRDISSGTYIDSVLLIKGIFYTITHPMLFQTRVVLFIHIQIQVLAYVITDHIIFGLFFIQSYFMTTKSA